MSNKDLYRRAEKAIEELFSDMSVSRDKCRENLQTLTGDIEGKLECLKEDEARERTEK